MIEKTKRLLKKMKFKYWLNNDCIYFVKRGKEAEVSGEVSYAEKMIRITTITKNILYYLEFDCKNVERIWVMSDRILDSFLCSYNIYVKDRKAVYKIFEDLLRHVSDIPEKKKESKLKEMIRNIFGW